MHTPAAVAAPPSLAEQLRIATREAHARAEQAGLMPALLAGRLPRGPYVLLQRQLHALYAALEAGLAAAPPALQPLARLVFDEGLARAPALAADLDALHGPGWPAALPRLPALQAMVARIEALAAARDAALAGHAYTRYLGDLYGGQMLRRRALAALGVAPDATQAESSGATPGTLFHDFGPPARVQALRGAFRDALAALPLGAAAQQAVVDEALWSFAAHERLFIELAAA